MDKIARKPSADPLQEKLREAKANWNKKVSELINDIIHAKKLLNGYPNKFYPSKSSIKEEIPADPHTIIGSLAGDFDNIVQQANKIIQEQIDYSKNRKKAIPKQRNLPGINQSPTPKPEPNPSQDLSKQLTMPGFADLEYDLLSEGSNPFSRFLTRITTPTTGFSDKAKLRRLRITLLNKSAELNRDIKKFQIEIVKKSPESIHEATTILTHIWNNWRMIFNELRDMKNKVAPELPDQAINEAELPLSEKDLDETVIQKMDEQINKIRQDISNAEKQINNFTINTALLQSLKESINAYEQAEKQDKAVLIPSILDNYKDLLKELSDKYKMQVNSISEVLNKLNLNAPELEATSQAFLKRWLGKARHQIFPHQTTHHRLKILDKSEVMRKDLDQIMDLFQKGFDIAQIYPLALEINTNLAYIRGIMRPLHNLTEKPLHKKK